jgi:hypothetical protein
VHNCPNPKSSGIFCPEKGGIFTSTKSLFSPIKGQIRIRDLQELEYFNGLMWVWETIINGGYTDSS